MQQRDGHAQCSSIRNQVLEKAPQSKPPGFHIVSINPGGNGNEIQWKFDADSTWAKTFFSQVMCDVRLVVHDYAE
jgi:hypothetical protein